MPARRLVLFVEGQGDVPAATRLVARLLDAKSAWDCLFLDDPMRVGAVDAITGRHKDKWLRFLKAAALRPDLGAVLLILDGDKDRVENQDFCAKKVACALAERAKEAGAGVQFSLACVFAMQEFEAWLIAGAASLVGKRLPDGSAGLKVGAIPPPDPEDIRNCKGWLGDHMEFGYKATIHQEPLSRLVDLDEIRVRKLKSFARLERALDQIINAIRTGVHVSTPCVAG